jgi:hypothetical protein
MSLSQLMRTTGRIIYWSKTNNVKCMYRTGMNNLHFHMCENKQQQQQQQKQKQQQQPERELRAISD